MNYRHVYMLIIEHARKEALERKRPLFKKERKNFDEYYEFHHVLPASLFPRWRDKKENIIALTPKEHFFCHELLVKIWPSYQMFKALSMFCVFNQDYRKLTPRQYEKIRQAAHNANLLFWKKNKNELVLKIRAAAKTRDNSAYKTDEFRNSAAERSKKCKWYNDGQNEYFVIEPKNGWVKGRIKLSKDEREKQTQKMRKTRANRTSEEKVLEFRRRSESNKKFPRKRNYVIGMHWYNNGIENKKFLSCPQGWQEGKLTHKEGKKVVCIETGEISYAKDLPGVHKNCNGYRSSFKGLHYQWYSENLEGGVSENLNNT